MERRTLQIRVDSARDLNYVNLVMEMEVYAVVKLTGAGNSKETQKFKTHVDKEGGSNPNWNFPMTFTVDEATARENRLALVFKLRCQRSLGDRDIGEVYVPVKELLESSGHGNGNSMQHLSYQVRKPSGNPQGVLNFSYKFGGKLAVGPAKPAAPEIWPATEYPAPAGPSSLTCGGAYPPPKPPEVYPPPSNLYPVLLPEDTAPPEPAMGFCVYSQSPPACSAYAPAPAPPQPGYRYHHQPPPHAAAAYGYPPPTYGYPPPPGGYGYYPPPSAGVGNYQPAKKNSMGLGLGAGLVGGMVGGLLIGDLVSDAAAYDAGYDAGFGDAGSFDF